MKNQICLFILLLLFSCKKDDAVGISSDTELWIRVDNSIESVDVAFIGKNAKGTPSSHVINYNNGVFTSSLKSANDTRDGGTWTLVFVSSEKSDEIEITCKNKKYRIRGFSCNERRFVQIVNSFNGSVSIQDHDISIIEKIILVD